MKEAMMQHHSRFIAKYDNRNKNNMEHYNEGHRKITFSGTGSLLTCE
jgi:hypothetical protein